MHVDNLKRTKQTVGKEERVHPIVLALGES